MLKNEMLEAMEIFNAYGITEERQRELFRGGIHFNFTYGDPDPMGINRRMDVFEFANMLKTFMFNGLKLEVNAMIDKPWDIKYEPLVKMITDKEIVTIRKLGDGDIAVNKPERLKVFFVGSFDPITKGHMNLIKQASNLFGEVVVAVMQNASKGEGFFRIDERVHIIKELYKNDRRVEVTTGTGAATDVALLHGCGAILRGLRGISDFEEEVKARQINKEISGCNLETIYLIADPEYRHISSSMVRELFALGKNIRSYVDPLVADKMIEKRK